MLVCLAMPGYMAGAKCATVLNSDWSTFYLVLGKTVAHILTKGNTHPHSKTCPHLCFHNKFTGRVEWIQSNNVLCNI